MKETKIVQGYKPDVYDSRDHIFGSGVTPHPIILPSGNWREAVSLVKEFQATRGFENYGCVTFTELNAYEKLAKVVLGEDWNKSERFTYIASDTDPKDRGNSPRKVADSIRKMGVIDEKELPFDDSIDTLKKFNSPIPLTNDLIKKGEDSLERYEFRYDRVLGFREISRDKLRKALKRSPIAIAVHAWTKNGVYIRPNDAPDTHLTLLENVKDNDELEVFDSYIPAHKTLSKDFPIYYAMRFYLEKKTPIKKLSWISRLIRGILKRLRMDKMINQPSQ